MRHLLVILQFSVVEITCVRARWITATKSFARYYSFNSNELYNRTNVRG